MLTTKDIENFKETFNDETPLGEPQHWIYLKSGRSLEITHEEEGLPEMSNTFLLDFIVRKKNLTMEIIIKHVAL